MLENLFENNQRWAKDIQRQNPRFFTELKKQQTPKYMWIGCSDSRVPANEIIGLAPGEVFVHRNVANLVVHSDLNALSTIQFAVDLLKVGHIIVVGHYGCSGVRAAFENQRVGLADNWLRHIQNVYNRHRHRFENIPNDKRADALCALNVVEQVVNVASTTIVQDAWDRKQPVTLHGWVYGLENGLLQDLLMTVRDLSVLEEAYRAAVERIFSNFNSSKIE